MSAPERIWIDTYPGAGFAFWTAPEESTTEYVRADLGSLPMTSEVAALLDDCKRALTVARLHYEVQAKPDDRRRTRHLAEQAQALTARIDAARELAGRCGEMATITETPEVPN